MFEFRAIAFEKIFILNDDKNNIIIDPINKIPNILIDDLYIFNKQFFNYIQNMENEEVNMICI